MILAAHQPHFLPWLGYFDKMRNADLFVLVDHVQFERQNYQNRTMMKTGEGPRWVTVPVRQCAREERIMEKLIDNHGDGRHRWGRTMALTLKYAYQSAPYFTQFGMPLLELIDARWDRLVDLNRALIDLCRDVLDIHTPLVYSSELDIQGANSDMVLAMCREVGADVYLAGAGASKSYLDAQAFAQAGIKIAWQDFMHPRYPQVPHPDTFIPTLSVFDLLVNCGPRSGAVLQGETMREAISAP